MLPADGSLSSHGVPSAHSTPADLQRQDTLFYVNEAHRQRVESGNNQFIDPLDLSEKTPLLHDGESKRRR